MGQAAHRPPDKEETLSGFIMTIDNQSEKYK